MATNTSWYKVGTVSTTAASKTITGVGTSWALSIKQGDIFTIDGHQLYEVASVESNTSLTLVKPYPTTTATQPYAIIQNFTSTLPAELAAELALMQRRWYASLKDYVDVLSTDKLTSVITKSDGTTVTVPSWKAITSPTVDQVEQATAAKDAAVAAKDAAVTANATAQTAATTAATKAADASTSATNAASSAASALMSKNDAATSASTATTQATNATNSAALAHKWATQTGSEVVTGQGFGAKKYAQDANTSFLDFDTRYLGAKASDPTTNNQGGALVAGASYFNTTSNTYRIYNGTVWATANTLNALPLTGGTMTGDIVLKGNATANLHPVTKQQMEAVTGTSGALSFRNRIINGNFAIAQRGLTQTTAGYGSVDRWQFGTSSGTYTITRGQDPTNMTGMTDGYYIAVNATSLVGGYMYQPIEGVRTLSGLTVTLSWYTNKVSGTNTTTKPYLTNNFGVGGSAQENIQGGSVTSLPTTHGLRYSITFVVPAISGKTIGASSFTQVVFPFDGTFLESYWGIQLEEGSVATPFEQRPVGLELSLCQRYYNTTTIKHVGYSSMTGWGWGASVSFAQMRSAPTVILGASAGPVNVSSFSAYSLSASALSYAVIPTSNGAFAVEFPVALSAEL